MRAPQVLFRPRSYAVWAVWAPVAAALARLFGVHAFGVALFGLFAASAIVFVVGIVANWLTDDKLTNWLALIALEMVVALAVLVFHDMETMR
jgi:4-amino-4-deoxy-L-arabinose transferase-like glycosyltransferase